MCHAYVQTSRQKVFRRELNKALHQPIVISRHFRLEQNDLNKISPKAVNNWSIPQTF